MSGKVVTGGKPYQSRLAPYEAEIDRLRLDGASIRGIAAEMFARHGLAVSHNAVASFLKTHRLGRRSFLDGIGETRKRELLRQLRAMWTHDSTSLEGNTLTLGDTMAVLEYGLTDFTVEPINEPLNGELDERLLKLAKTHPGAQLPYMKSVVGKSLATVKRAIAALVAAGLIEHRGSKKTGGYYVKEVV